MRPAFARRKYIFTKGNERLEFNSATEARKHFYICASEFPSKFLGRTWHEWKVEAEPWTKGSLEYREGVNVKRQSEEDLYIQEWERKERKRELVKRVKSELEKRRGNR